MRIMTQDKITKTPRLYVSDALKSGQSLALAQNQSHYIKNVFRMHVGDTVRLFNGRDGEWAASLDDITKKSATLSPRECLRPQETAPALHLVFAPVKKHRMDMITEKCTELGVSDFHPVLTERTEVRKINKERLSAQVIEASEQSERLCVPSVHDLVPMAQKIQELKDMRLYAGLERAEAKLLSNSVNDGPSGLVIGPVGGFTDSEHSALSTPDHITPVNLGPRILRAETACIMGIGYLSLFARKNKN